jgi:hypothetical protein
VHHFPRRGDGRRPATLPGRGDDSLRLLGVVPLVVATGAGVASRRDIGVTVFSGMLAATVIGIILIPGLFVVFQRMSEWRWRRT